MFTLLVLSTTGGMAKESTVFFMRIADAIAEKRKLPYSKVMGWLWCRVSFALIRSAIRAIRGSKSHRVFDTSAIPLASSEDKVDY